VTGAGRAVVAAERDVAATAARKASAAGMKLPSGEAASAAPAQAKGSAASRPPGTKKAIAVDVRRIAELKAKLGDEAYMAGAILRIATVLSARLTEGYMHGGRTTRGQTRMDGAK
jgi:hypothetical protein